MGVRLLMQTAIEAEVTEFLDQERYSHGERSRAGSRNGPCPTTIKTTAGPVTVERPKLRGTDEAFASRLLGVGVCRTNAPESLVIAGFVRGLSVRDVEATLSDALGAEAALSKSTVSRICEASRTSSMAGNFGTCPRCRWNTCFWTARSSARTKGSEPSLYSRRGGSPARDAQCWSASRREQASPPTPGMTSLREWSPAVCAPRCWSSPMALPV